MPFATNKAGDADDGDMTIYQALFEMTNTLCKIYPALTPFSVRRERVKEVFLLYRRIITKSKTEEGQKVDSQGRILVPAGDDWF